MTKSGDGDAPLRSNLRDSLRQEWVILSCRPGDAAFGPLAGSAETINIDDSVYQPPDAKSPDRNKF